MEMEMEAVTQALRWIASRGDSQTTHAIILTYSTSLLQKSGMGSPNWNVSVVVILPRNPLWVYCPGHAGVKRNDRADRLVGKATITSGLHLGRSVVLRSSRHYLRAKSQRHHTIDRLEERDVERGSVLHGALLIRLIRDGRMEVGDEGWREITYLSLHCHRQNDSCIKMGSDKNHFNVSLTVRDKVTRQCPQTTSFEEKEEPKRDRAEVLLLTSLTPYR